MALLRKSFCSSPCVRPSRHAHSEPPITQSATKREGSSPREKSSGSCHRGIPDVRPVNRQLNLFILMSQVRRPPRRSGQHGAGVSPLPGIRRLVGQPRSEGRMKRVHWAPASRPERGPGTGNRANSADGHTKGTAFQCLRACRPVVDARGAGRPKCTDDG